MTRADPLLRRLRLVPHVPALMQVAVTALAHE
jgi:hypothetical protein